MDKGRGFLELLCTKEPLQGKVTGIEDARTTGWSSEAG